MTLLLNPVHKKYLLILHGHNMIIFHPWLLGEPEDEVPEMLLMSPLQWGTFSIPWILLNTSPPNHTHYWVNWEEYAEIKWQVDELYKDLFDRV